MDMYDEDRTTIIQGSQSVNGGNGDGLVKYHTSHGGIHYIGQKGSMENLVNGEK